MSDDLHQSNSSPAGPRRGNLKSVTHSQTKAQWKESLRSGCLERAKLARRERLRKSRRSDSDNNCNGVDLNDPTSSGETSNHTNGSGSSGQAKRGREDDHRNGWCEVGEMQHGSIVDHTPGDRSDGAMKNNPEMLHRLESGDSEENVVDTARALVEQELRRAMAGVQHCHQVCPMDGGLPTKKPYHGGFARELDTMDSDLIEPSREERDCAKDEYIISHEEFVELLNEVTEELEKEGE